MFWCIVFAVGLFARLLYGLFCNVELQSDMLKCFNAALSITQGDYTWTEDWYFEVWAYQIPFVYYEAGILFVFKTIRYLYVFDALWSIVVCIFVYIITKQLTRDKLVALIVAAIYSWLPSSLLKIGVLYNFSISAAIMLAGVYLFIKFVDKCHNHSPIKISHYLYPLFSGLLFSLSCLFRQESIILLIACLCFVVYDCITVKLSSKHDIRKQYIMYITRMTISFIGLIVGFVLVVIVCNLIVINLGISRTGLSNNCPYWQIVCGLTPENNGQYSDKYHWILNVDSSEQSEAFKTIMHDIFKGKSPLDVLLFFCKKNFYMWGAPDEGFGIPFLTVFDRVFTMFYLAVDKFIYLLFVILSFFVDVKHKGMKKNSILKLFMIAFMGFFLVYFVKEAGARYRYDSILILTFLSSFGILKLKNRQKKYLN